MAINIGRREFVFTLGGAAAAWPLVARAQQPAMPVVGLVTARAAGDAPHLMAAFRQGLQDIGFVERQNVAIEYRFAGNQNERLLALAADLVNHQVTVIAGLTTPAALAAKAATTTIPIVFETGADPVQLGLVASLNRPGGNVTGVTNISAETAAKRVGLLHELLPQAARFAALVNPNDPLLAEASIKETRAAAAAIGRQLEILTASTDGEVDSAFTSIAQKQVESLLVLPDSLFSTRRVQIVIQAARHGVPAIYYDRSHAEAGGLKLKAFCELMKLDEKLEGKEDAVLERQVDKLLDQLGADFKVAWTTIEDTDEQSPDGRALSAAVDQLEDKCPD